MGGIGNLDKYMQCYLGACQVAVHLENLDKASILLNLSCNLDLLAHSILVVLGEVLVQVPKSALSPEYRNGRLDRIVIHSKDISRTVLEPIPFF
jgi:hypothetical protein